MVLQTFATHYLTSATKFGRHIGALLERVALYPSMKACPTVTHRQRAMSLQRNSGAMYHRYGKTSRAVTDGAIGHRSADFYADLSARCREIGIYLATPPTGTSQLSWIGVASSSIRQSVCSLCSGINAQTRQIGFVNISYDS